MPIATDIKTAAVAAVSALALSPTPAVDGRKTPALPAGKTPPAVVCAVGEAGDVEDLWAGYVLKRYPLTVAIYVATTGATQDGSTVETWRQAIGRKLNDRAAFPTVSGLNDVWQRDEAAFAPAGLPDLTNASFLYFGVEVIEPRN